MDNPKKFKIIYYPESGLYFLKYQRKYVAWSNTIGMYELTNWLSSGYKWRAKDELMHDIPTIKEHLFGEKIQEEEIVV